MREAEEQHQRGVALSIKSSEVIERSGVNGLHKEGQFSAGKCWGTLVDPLITDESGSGECSSI